MTRKYRNRLCHEAPPIDCLDCPDSFPTYKSLGMHMKFAHRGKRRPQKHLCPFSKVGLCFHITKGTYNAQVHLDTHTGEQRYECLCGTAFSDQSSRKRHYESGAHKKNLLSKVRKMGTSTSSTESLTQPAKQATSSVVATASTPGLDPQSPPDTPSRASSPEITPPESPSGMWLTLALSTTSDSSASPPHTGTRSPEWCSQHANSTVVHTPQTGNHIAPVASVATNFLPPLSTHLSIQHSEIPCTSGRSMTSPYGSTASSPSSSGSFSLLTPPGDMTLALSSPRTSSTLPDISRSQPHIIASSMQWLPSETNFGQMSMSTSPHPHVHTSAAVAPVATDFPPAWNNYPPRQLRETPFTSGYVVTPSHDLTANSPWACDPQFAQNQPTNRTVEDFTGADFNRPGARPNFGLQNSLLFSNTPPAAPSVQTDNYQFNDQAYTQARAPTFGYNNSHQLQPPTRGPATASNLNGYALQRRRYQGKVADWETVAFLQASDLMPRQSSGWFDLNDL